MSDYLKVRLGIRCFSDADSSVKLFDTSSWEEYALTPDEVVHMKVEAATTGTTVTTSIYSSVTLVAIQNDDSTNYVTATFRTAGNSSTDNIVRIPAGGFLLVTDFTAANNLVLTANTAECNCRVIIAGT